jgi:hypothetical protein
MELYELLGYIARCFKKIKIPYLVTGAVASIAYGEPRLTNDIDVVADLKEDDIPRLKRCFPEEEFFFDVEFALKAVRRKSQFNIINAGSGLKVDIIAKRKDAFDESRFHRIKRFEPLAGTKVNFASPEDVIIKKMQYYVEGRSDKHIRDIVGMLRISEDLIDVNYVERWAQKLGLNNVWQEIKRELGSIRRCR